MAGIADCIKLIQALDNKSAVGISGLDGAGKTTFTNKLAENLKQVGIQSTLLHIDDFNNHDVQARIYDAYMQGKFTDAHFRNYYEASIDYGRVAAAIAEAKKQGLVIIEGVFLFKPQLNHLFDLRINIDVDPKIARVRFAKRKAEIGDPRPVEVFDDIWLPAFKKYVGEHGKNFRIDIIIPNG